MHSRRECYSVYETHGSTKHRTQLSSDDYDPLFLINLVQVMKKVAFAFYSGFDGKPRASSSLPMSPDSDTWNTASPSDGSYAIIN